MPLKHEKTMFDFTLRFFITHFCCGETGKVSETSFMLSSTFFFATFQVGKIMSTAMQNMTELS